jgi:hypothetical protein
VCDEQGLIIETYHNFQGAKYMSDKYGLGTKIYSIAVLKDEILAVLEEY